MLSRPTSKAMIVIPKNERLAHIAIRAITDPDFIEEPGMCMAFVRQCIQEGYGTTYNAYFYRGTAEGSRLAFARSPFKVSPLRGSLIGDILFKKASRGQPEGHVGIRIPGNRVAENSSLHRNGTHGGKDTRSLAAFGKVDLIVRLHNPQ